MEGSNGFTNTSASALLQRDWSHMPECPPLYLSPVCLPAALCLRVTSCGPSSLISSAHGDPSLSQPRVAESILEFQCLTALAQALQPPSFLSRRGAEEPLVHLATRPQPQA